MTSIPIPTDANRKVEAELHRWSNLFSGDEPYYGHEPGPIARRAVRYHRASMRRGGSAFDAGCGEGQDLAWLASQGYSCRGLDFTPEGVAKTRRLLEHRGLAAQVEQADLSLWRVTQQFDLVLCVNALQFLGVDAPRALEQVMLAVARGGVLGLSVFAREREEEKITSTIYRWTLDELLHLFRDWQPLEAAKLWQWNTSNNQAQAFATLIARNTPPLV